MINTIFFILVITPLYIVLILFLAKTLFILLELIVDDIEKEKRKKQMKSPFYANIKNKLRCYPKLKKADENIKDELEEIECKLTSRSANPTSYNFGSSDFNSTEQSRVELLSRKRILDEQLMKNKKSYDDISKMLKFLNTEELSFIELKFFEGYTYEKIGEIKYCDKSTAQRHVDVAVLKILEGLYGDIY